MRAAPRPRATWAAKPEGLGPSRRIPKLLSFSGQQSAWVIFQNDLVVRRIGPCGGLTGRKTLALAAHNAKVSRAGRIEARAPRPTGATTSADMTGRRAASTSLTDRMPRTGTVSIGSSQSFP
jgi:hypothetical protein